jgi:hypothetical protein
VGIAGNGVAFSGSNSAPRVIAVHHCERRERLRSEQAYAASRPTSAGTRASGRTIKGDSVGDKSPKKTNVKKPASSLKEKRAAKHEKQRDSKFLGDR